MKKMISSLWRVFLIAAVIIMPLQAMNMSSKVVQQKQALFLGKIVQEANKIIDAAIATISLLGQEPDLNTQKQIYNKENFIFKASQINMANVMNNPALDRTVKNRIAGDVGIIQKTVLQSGTDSEEAYQSLKASQAAYERLLDTVADITQANSMQAAPQGRIQQMIAYITRKIQEAKQAVSNMWYGKKKGR